MFDRRFDSYLVVHKRKAYLFSLLLVIFPLIYCTRPSTNQLLSNFNYVANEKIEHATKNLLWAPYSKSNQVFLKDQFLEPAPHFLQRSKI